MRGIKLSTQLPFRLISTDFDGTLICPTHQPPFPEVLRRDIQALREAGVVWVINTGRPLQMVHDGVAEHLATLLPDYIVSSERDIHIREGVSGWVEHHDWNNHSRVSHDELYVGLEEFFSEVETFFAENPGAGRTIEWGGRVEGILTETEEHMEQFVKFLDNNAPRWPLLGWQRNTVYLRFSHRDFHKGSALGALASRLGIAREEIFAAGDNYNDLSMLDGRYAKWVACPSNSVDEVRATVRGAGGYVAEGHAGLGVAEALEHFCGRVLG